MVVVAQPADCHVYRFQVKKQFLNEPLCFPGSGVPAVHLHVAGPKSIRLRLRRRQTPLTSSTEREEPGNICLLFQGSLSATRRGKQIVWLRLNVLSTNLAL